jgi:hypothetical protein
MAAGKCGATLEEMERYYNALRDSYLSVTAQPNFQRFNILDLVVAEERNRKGKTPPSFVEIVTTPMFSLSVSQTTFLTMPIRESVKPRERND